MAEPDDGIDDDGIDDGGIDDDRAETVETLDDGDVSYDCAAWAGESRGLLAALLTSRGVAHVWQGTTLSVREEDEELVDDLIDEVLASARPALDPGAEKVVYEVGEWPPALQTMLTDSLTVADLPYEWDEAGDLVVYAEHEEEVEAILDEMPDPDDPELVGDVSADDGIAVHELFDALFLASGKLAHKPDDSTAVLSVADTVGVLEQMGPPFGFEVPQWRTLVQRAVVLRDALAAGPGADDALDDDALKVVAGDVRDLVRQYI